MRFIHLRKKSILRYVPVLIVLISTVAASAQAPEPITLSKAVAIALEKNPMRKAALAENKAARQMPKLAFSAFLPRIQFSETAMRSNDPVFVFGAKLRQQVFAEPDFAIDSLNRPTPYTDISSRFAGQWSLFDTQNWFGYSRAKLMTEASANQLERNDQEVMFRVVQAYYGVLLAQRQLEIAERAVSTAEAIEQTSRNRVESGVAVDSDLLSAQVQTASRKQERIKAQGNVSLAQAAFALAMGLPADTKFQFSDAPIELGLLPSPNELEAKAMTARPDLKRVKTEQLAQDKSVSMAKYAFAPRLNALAQWQTDGRSLGWGNAGNNWTAGVELQFELFTGGAKLARLSQEKANLERATAMKQAFEDNVRLEVRRAYYDADAARQQVDVAKAAIAQADESLRIQKNRYESGLTTVTDLLRVEDAAHQAQTNYWSAVYGAATSYAALELATGTLNQNSPVVKP